MRGTTDLSKFMRFQRLKDYTMAGFQFLFQQKPNHCIHVKNAKSKECVPPHAYIRPEDQTPLELWDQSP